jgi:hypothetical protein
VAESHDLGPARSQGLVDVLDRILDKGLVVAGDIRIRLADVELLTIQIRLLVCSVDKAEEIGLDWWRTEPRFSSLAAGQDAGRLADSIAGLSERLDALERKNLKES